MYLIYKVREIKDTELFLAIVTPLTKLGELGKYALESEILAPALQDLAWK